MGTGWVYASAAEGPWQGVEIETNFFVCDFLTWKPSKDVSSAVSLPGHQAPGVRDTGQEVGG